MNAVAPGPWLVAAGFAVLLVMLFGWFGAVIGESEARLLQQEGGRVVPLEHELVHLLRGDVLLRLLRRAVLHPQLVGARPGRPDVEARLARLHGELADERPVHQRAVHADGRDRDPAAQHDHPA